MSFQIDFPEFPLQYKREKKIEVLRLERDVHPVCQPFEVRKPAFLNLIGEKVLLVHRTNEGKWDIVPL